MTHSNSVNVVFCRRCLYGSDHPLGITFDADGICSGCRIHEEKDRLDWKERWDRLEKVINPFRLRNGNNYDCIVPVTGGHESYWVVHLVKERLKLNPLLVTYNKYFNTELGIRNLANLRIKFNCDILIQNVNPESVKRITRTTLRQFGSMYWPCIAGQTVWPVQVAVSHGIPLIIWGAHQGVEQVGMFSHLHEVQMTRRYRKEHDLMGFEANDILTVFDSLKEEDIWQYRYPDDEKLNAIGVTGIYLSNYVRWDPKCQDESMISNYGFKAYHGHRSFETYDHVDCFNYQNLHDLLKLYKHGYSKVTDHACREIRHGRLTRFEGECLVQHYEERPIQNLDLFQRWLGVSETGCQFLLDQHRNSKYWTQQDWQQWRFTGWSKLRSEEYHDTNILLEKKLGFIYHGESSDDERRYITIGKGYPT